MYGSAQNYRFLRRNFGQNQIKMVDNIQRDTGNAIPPPGEKSFIVLECKEVLNRNNRLVCILSTWIKCVFRTKVAFVYPAEDEDIILRRIKNKEPDACWRHYSPLRLPTDHYFGEIKFETESFEDAVDYLRKIRECDSKQIEDKNNTIEPVIKPVESVKHKTPQKNRIDMSKLNLKLGTTKKSEKKHHKKHLKEKIHKSKYMELLSLKKKSTRRSSQNSVNTQTSSKNEEVMVHKPVCSVTQTLLKNNDNKRPSSNEVLLKTFDRKGNGNKGMLSEDRKLMQNMCMKIVKQVQFLETTALEIRRAHLVAIENQKVLEQLAAKYRVQLPSATIAERDIEHNSVQIAEENLQDDAMETQEDITEDEEGIENNESASEYQPETEDEMDDEQDSEENKRATKGNQFEDNHDEMAHEAENNKKNYSASEENQFEEHEDEISIEDFVLPRIPEDDREDISKENNRETLKYQRPRKGLILVGKDSPFYISAKELDRIEDGCRNVKDFVYRIFGAVFSSKALRTCSIDGLNGRPALHYEARTFLKYYSLEYGRSRGWKSIQPEEIDDVIVTLLEDQRKGRYTREPSPLNERRRPKKYFD